MRAGALKHRIEIQSREISRDEYGEPNGTWKRYATVWAAINTKMGREFFEADKVVGETKDVFEIRYMEGIDRAMRILYRGKIYQVEAISNFKELNTNIFILTKVVE